MAKQFKPGDTVVVGRRLGRIVEVVDRGPMKGYHVQEEPCTLMEGYGSRWASTVKPVVLGETVCDKPWPTCCCPLAHTRYPEVVELLREELARSTGEVS